MRIGNSSEKNNEKHRHSKKKKAKKPRITNEMIEWKRESGKCKYTGGKRKYKQLNNEIRRTTDKARDKW